MRRANGRPLHTVVEPSAQVRLVQTVTIPSQKGRVVEARVDSSACVVERCADSTGSEFLFEPEHEVLEKLGVWTQESLIHVQPDGRALIPVQNFQGMPIIRLDEGMQLGVASQCEPSLLDEPEPQSEPVEGLGVPVGGVCACVEALSDTAERYEKLMSLLELPDGLSACEAEKLNDLLRKSTDVFAFDDSELGRTDVVCHNKIDTGDHEPVRQPPYRIPMVHREVIGKMVREMQDGGIVQPSVSPWASPVVLVPKKDGSLRFCVDYSRLNALTKKDVYPLPRVDDIVDTLSLIHI